MKKNLPGGRFRLIFAAIAACLVIGIVLTFSSILDQSTIAGPKGETGTQEKMIVASANIALDVDVNRLNGINSRPKTSSLRFTAVPDTFFTVLVFNNELRGPLPSSLELRPVDAPALPAGFCLQDMAENGDLSWSRTTFFLFWRYGREVLERGAWRPAGTARTAERG